MGDNATALPSFRIYGGRCRVEPVEDEPDSPKQLRLNQTVLRHLHILRWTVAVILCVMAVYLLITGRNYGPRPYLSIPWWMIFVLGLVDPATIPLRWAYDRMQGFTWAKVIDFDQIETIECDKTLIRGYFKRSKEIPAFLVRYSMGGSTKKRRIMFRPGFEESELRNGIRMLKSFGFELSGTDAFEPWL